MAIQRSAARTVSIRPFEIDNLNQFRRDAPAILDSDSAARFLGVSTRLLSESLDEMGIPYRRMGRTLIFSRDALIDWVRNSD